jgi:hypothetical protein
MNPMRQNLALPISLAIVLAILFVGAGVGAKLVAAPGEQITLFTADIVVNPDATLTVTEDFVVHSEGAYFKYGFIRNLPIDDEARWDHRYAGEWKADNGIRVRILELTENESPHQLSAGTRSRLSAASDRADECPARAQRSPLRDPLYRGRSA